MPEKLPLSCFCKGVDSQYHTEHALMFYSGEVCLQPRYQGGSVSFPLKGIQTPLLFSQQTELQSQQEKQMQLVKEEQRLVRPRAAVWGQHFPKEAASFWQILQSNKYFLRNKLIKIEWLTRTALMRSLKQEKETPMQEPCWAQRRQPKLEENFL